MFDTNSWTICPPPPSSIHRNQRPQKFPCCVGCRLYVNVCVLLCVCVCWLQAKWNLSVSSSPVSLGAAGQWGGHRLSCRLRLSRCLTNWWHRFIHTQQVWGRSSRRTPSSSCRSFQLLPRNSSLKVQSEQAQLQQPGYTNTLVKLAAWLH